MKVERSNKLDRLTQSEDLLKVFFYLERRVLMFLSLWHKWINGKGLTPDILIASSEKEAEDPQLERAFQEVTKNLVKQNE